MMRKPEASPQSRGRRAPLCLTVCWQIAELSQHQTRGRDDICKSNRTGVPAYDIPVGMLTVRSAPAPSLLHAECE